MIPSLDNRPQLVADIAKALSAGMPGALLMRSLYLSVDKWSKPSKALDLALAEHRNARLFIEKGRKGK